MTLNLKDLADEVTLSVQSIDINNDGEHLHSNYQYVMGLIIRFQEIHNDIAMEEIKGTADADLKKFRTLIVDPTIEKLEKVAAYESRKITSRQIEANLDR